MLQILPYKQFLDYWILLHDLIRLSIKLLTVDIDAMTGLICFGLIELHYFLNIMILYFSKLNLRKPLIWFCLTDLAP